MSELLSFDEVKTAALAYCEADDVREKLGAAELDQETIDIVVDLKSKMRVGEFTMATLTALDAHRERLCLERAVLDDQIEQVEEILLGQNSFGLEVADEPKPELSVDLIQKLAIGVVDRETFIDSAMVYGVTQNVAARTFRIFGRYGASNQTVDLDQLFTELMQDNNREDLHPLLGRSGVGPAILEASFAVTEAYLTALDTIEPAQAD